MRLRIRASYDSFRELREDQAYYIDKTEVLQDYLVESFEKAMLFARPRRFGKTVTMTMIRDFLDIRQDSREIFEGLQIMQHPDTVRAFMNQYPVVFISLKEVFGKSFEDVLQNFRIAVSEMCESYRVLLKSEATGEASKDFLDTLLRRKGKQPDTEQAQEALGQILEATLSFYHEYHEYSCHLILDGFFTGLGYRVLSETETCYGRSDLVILDPARRRCLILELKHVKKEEQMEAALHEAQSQLIRQKYESILVYQGYTNRLRYAMAFWDKRVMIAEV